MSKNKSHTFTYQHDEIPSDGSFSFGGSSSSSDGEASSNDDDSAAGVVSGIRGALQRYPSLSVQPYKKVDAEDDYDNDGGVVSSTLFSTDDFLDVPLEGIRSNSTDVEIPPSILFGTNHHEQSSRKSKKIKNKNASKTVAQLLTIDNEPLKLNDGIVISEEDVTRYEREKDKKSKSKKRNNKKSKKAIRGASTTSSTQNSDGTRRAAVFQKIFNPLVLARGGKKAPPPMDADFDFGLEISGNRTAGSLELADLESHVSFGDDDDYNNSNKNNDGNGKNDDLDGENYFDPNDECPKQQSSFLWSMSSFGRMSTFSSTENDTTNHTNYNPFQTSNDRTMASEKSPKYRLNKIKEFIRSPMKKKESKGTPVYEPVVNLAPRGSFERHDSIVWADESYTDRQVEEAYFMDACVDQSFNDSDHLYQGVVNFADNFVRKRRRKCYLVISIVLVIVIGLFLGVFLAKKEGNISSNPLSLTPDLTTLDENENKNETLKELSQIPFPIPLDEDENNNETPKELSQIDLIYILEDLNYIAGKITPDKSVFNDPASPQSKAKEWCKTDMKNYDDETADRVAQRYILAIFYFSTNGEGWLDSTSWLNGHECMWYGIECDEMDGINSVTSLILSDNGLGGEIPSELGHLTSLRVLDLSFNKLSGSIIFDTISNLEHLEVVHLNNNLLTGELSSIPEEIDVLENFEEFRIENNDLQGSMPDFVCDLSLTIFTADCGESQPLVECSCCTECF